jgi:preprotein translocase subunit SecD
MVDPEDPRIRQARPGWALFILAAPLVLFAIVVVGYSALVGAGLRGRTATGERTTLTFRSCPEARPFLEARVADVGLADATFEALPDGLALTATLPGDPEVAEALPATLATPGVLEVRDGQTVLATNDDIVDASVRLDLFMIPSTLLRLTPEAGQRLSDWTRDHQDGMLTFVLDGRTIGHQTATNPVATGELEIATDDLPDRQRMHATAAWGVVLDHGPLPCAVTAVPDSP